MVASSLAREDENTLAVPLALFIKLAFVTASILVFNVFLCTLLGLQFGPATDLFRRLFLFN